MNAIRQPPEPCSCTFALRLGQQSAFNYKHDHMAHGFPMISMPLHHRKKGQFTDYNVAYSPANGSPSACLAQPTWEQGCPEVLRLNLAILALAGSALACAWYELCIHGLACQPTETCARLGRETRHTSARTRHHCLLCVHRWLDG